MKNIAFFCIPAHGHTNPMIGVARELVSRGNHVRFYSFDEFEEKIKSTGAEFVSCESYLPKITDAERARLKKSSNTEMSIQDIRITLAMNEFLENEFKTFKPDVVYTDSVCFWGKLNAWKFNVPMVVSTSTFAFNQMSTTYMKNSPAELADMIFGLPKISRELKTLEPYGYKYKSALSLVQSDNDTDSIVYASRLFQPYVESYSDHYLFAGPSVSTDIVPNKKKDRPLVYISLGTVVNEKPDFYKNCIKGLKDINADIIISYGKDNDISALGNLPDNIKAYPYVNQLDVLSRADAFISHCGMNSASESLFMAVPLILFPQTGEQHAVARRAYELGAGRYLKKDTPEEIRKAVEEVLGDSKYADAAKKCSDDFRSCPGMKGAADFIENAPHEAGENEFIRELNKKNSLFGMIFWGILSIMIIVAVISKIPNLWVIPTFLGALSKPLGDAFQTANYKKMTQNNKK
ncbi:MAG: glycosyl transferase [Clostridia bacterium]|nr:glycosyl transferase [Clostridia bacterium]